MNNDTHSLPISQITIGKRHRKDLGDLAALAASIESGLLQPIGVTPEMDLIWGYRRLLATRDILKRQEIACRIVSVVSIAQVGTEWEISANIEHQEMPPRTSVSLSRSSRFAQKLFPSLSPSPRALCMH